MQKRSDGKFLFIYLLLIASAELTVAYINPETGILIHIGILCLFFIHSGLLSKDHFVYANLQELHLKKQEKTSDLLQTLVSKKATLSSLLLSLTLVPLIRIVSLVMPLSHFPRIQWFLIIGIAIYLAFFIILFQQKIKVQDCGLRLPKIQHLPIELGITLIGIPFGYAEYLILKPASFIDSLSFENIFIAFFILLITTGLMEELIFRGLLQNEATDILGPRYGILFITLIFSILHIGNLSILDILLVFCIGGLYAIVVHKTKTVIGVTFSHTVVNIFLFIICPFTLA